MTERDLQNPSPDEVRERLSDGHDHRFVMEPGGMLNVQRRSTPSTRTHMQMAQDYGLIQGKGGFVRVTSEGYELLSKPVNKFHLPSQEEFQAAIVKGVVVVE